MVANASEENIVSIYPTGKQRVSRNVAKKRGRLYGVTIQNISY